MAGVFTGGRDDLPIAEIFTIGYHITSLFHHHHHLSNWITSLFYNKTGHQNWISNLQSSRETQDMWSSHFARPLSKQLTLKWRGAGRLVLWRRWETGSFSWWIPSRSTKMATSAFRARTFLVNQRATRFFSPRNTCQFMAIHANGLVLLPSKIDSIDSCGSQKFYETIWDDLWSFGLLNKVLTHTHPNSAWRHHEVQLLSISKDIFRSFQDWFKWIIHPKHPETHGFLHITWFDHPNPWVSHGFSPCQVVVQSITAQKSELVEAWPWGKSPELIPWIYHEFSP